MYVHVCICARARVCVCVCLCVCVCEGGERVMLVRHLCVLHVSFGCLELCVFSFDCLLYAPWALLRKGPERPHYYYHFIIIIIIIIAFARIGWLSAPATHTVRPRNTE